MLSELQRLGMKCHEILDEFERPMHYSQLANLALDALDPPYMAGGSGSEARVRARQVEDVRYNLALPQRFDMMYLPEPHCLVASRGWFVDRREQAQNLCLWNNLDIGSHERSGSITAARRAALQAIRVFPKLLQKSPNKVGHENGASVGFVIEEELREWFKETWPTLFKNGPEGRTPIDWWFVVDGKRWAVDGLSAINGVASFPRDKHRVDIHVVGEAKGKNWEPVGYLFGNEIPTGRFDVTKTRPIVQLIVWLNCHKFGLPYKELSEIAERGEPTYRVDEILPKVAERAR